MARHPNYIWEQLARTAHRKLYRRRHHIGERFLQTALRAKGLDHSVR